MILNLQKKENVESGHNNILTFEEMKNYEKENIIRALNLTNWRISGKDGAAELLKIPRTTLTSKINRFKIKRVAM